MWMMEDKPFAFVIITGVFAMVLLAGLRCRSVYMDPCVMIQPREVHEGWIGTNISILGANTENYNIAYEGKRRQSDEVCFVVKQVTESQYERLMYNENQ